MIGKFGGDTKIVILDDFFPRSDRQILYNIYGLRRHNKRDTLNDLSGFQWRNSMTKEEPCFHLIISNSNGCPNRIQILLNSKEMDCSSIGPLIGQIYCHIGIVCIAGLHFMTN